MIRIFFFQFFFFQVTSQSSLVYIFNHFPQRSQARARTAARRTAASWASAASSTARGRWTCATAAWYGAAACRATSSTRRGRATCLRPGSRAPWAGPRSPSRRPWPARPGDRARARTRWGSLGSWAQATATRGFSTMSVSVNCWTEAVTIHLPTKRNARRGSSLQIILVRFACKYRNIVDG